MNYCPLFVGSSDGGVGPLRPWLDLNQAPAEELTRPTLDQQAVDDDFRRLREENAKLHNMVVEEEMRRVQGALDAIEQKFQSVQELDRLRAEERSVSRQELDAEYRRLRNSGEVLTIENDRLKERIRLHQYEDADEDFGFGSFFLGSTSIDQSSLATLDWSCTTTLTAQAWAGPTSIPRGAV